MSWLEALILGIIQGLTEFLPVSSSGHLEIGQTLLGTAGEDNLTFAIAYASAESPGGGKRARHIHIKGVTERFGFDGRRISQVFLLLLQHTDMCDVKPVNF